MSSSEMASSETPSPSVGVFSAGNSSTEISRNATSETSSATTTHALYPPFSSSATITKSTFFVATTFYTTVPSSAESTSTATPPQESHDNAVRMGIGVGVGLGGTAAISVAVGILIWWWRQYDLKLKNEAHERRKEGFRIRHWQDQQRQDDASVYSTPTPQEPNFVTGADVLPHPTGLRLSDHIVEDTMTPRMMQMKEPDFFIEAGVVPPMRESEKPGLAEADDGIVRR
ncbi:hypothetical protein MMC29_005101 [Sticta canariensis]|nr:hypothetical protein [Sticta canariensis]